jgi:hypothetical protein
MSALPPIADIPQCRWDVRKVPEADIQVLGPDSCLTLLSSIEIIREFQKGAGHDEARAPVHARTAMSEKDRQSYRLFRLRAAADWV